VEYDCEIILANKIYTDFNKVVRPLCSSCTNHSCTNPVKEKKVSVFGKIYTGRFFYNGDTFFVVTSCEGYRGIQEDDVENNIDEEGWN